MNTIFKAMETNMAAISIFVIFCVKLLEISIN